MNRYTFLKNETNISKTKEKAMQKLLTVYVHHFLLSLRASCAKETAGLSFLYIDLFCWSSVLDFDSP